MSDPSPAQEEFPRWPLWLPLAAALCGLAGGTLLTSIGVAAVEAGGTHVGKHSSGLTAGSTFAVELCVVAASVLLAGTVARPRAWQFGLRGAPLGFTLKITGMGLAAFYLFSVVYANLVNTSKAQKIVNDLGANQSTAQLVIGAVVVIVAAPVLEEIFFRGFLYRTLRLQMGMWPAAVADGVLFGLTHGVSVVLPMLIFLGIVFCYVYERTGTVFATIALHALNNAISYGATTTHGWAVSIPLGALLITGCAVAVARAPRRSVPAPA